MPPVRRASRDHDRAGSGAPSARPPHPSAVYSAPQVGTDVATMTGPVDAGADPEVDACVAFSWRANSSASSMSSAAMARSGSSSCATGRRRTRATVAPGAGRSPWRKTARDIRSKASMSRPVLRVDLLAKPGRAHHVDEERRHGLALAGQAGRPHLRDERRARCSQTGVGRVRVDHRRVSGSRVG